MTKTNGKLMAYYKYRRKRSESTQMLLDVAYVANRISWQWCIVLGFFLFTIFYFVLPAWIIYKLDSMNGNLYKPIIEAVFLKRLHWFEWLGIALGIICGFFSIRNYFIFERVGKTGERNVGFFSKILAKLLDS